MLKYKVSVLTEAELDINHAYIWYELRNIGLGNIFFKTINNSVQFISNNPFSSELIFKDIRRHIVKKFPYGVYYRVNENNHEIQIIGIIHFKRSNKIIRKRI
jgi:hypothetical protein